MQRSNAVVEAVGCRRAREQTANTRLATGATASPVQGLAQGGQADGGAAGAVRRDGTPKLQRSDTVVKAVEGMEHSRDERGLARAERSRMATPPSDRQVLARMSFH
jgi:hypothetical protein